MSIIKRPLKLYNSKNIKDAPQYQLLGAEEKSALSIVSQVIPFRVNNYVLDELIDWNNIPDDPMYQLTFLQKEMLQPHHYSLIAEAARKGASDDTLCELGAAVQLALNPHPAGQMTDNVPKLNGRPVAGVQHKYKETCLIFPAAGQTCYSFCTYCYRWPQFVGRADLKFSTDESNRFVEYIKQHKEITDILLTGGDPMIMNAGNLSVYLSALIGPECEHIKSIRIGTKSLSYWPYRFVTDTDADDVLRLFEGVVSAGKHLSIMAHCSHWRELSTDVAQEAIRRIRRTGAVIRTQSPLVKHVNDSPSIWQKLWETQVQLGCVPYYMFVARDTGANHYFAVPLNQAYETFQTAFKNVSGLCRTVRGPSMSMHAGKVMINGVAVIHGEKVFVLNFLQARNADLCQVPFFACFDDKAIWFDQLRPAFGNSEFMFDDNGEAILNGVTVLSQLEAASAWYANELIQLSR